MTLQEWLHEPTDHREHSLDAPVQVPRYERIAFLVACNGGFDVYQWGIIGYKGGPFRCGLEQDEALDLIQYASFLGGVEFAVGGVNDVLKPLFDDYMKRRQKAYETATASPSPAASATEGEG